MSSETDELTNRKLRAETELAERKLLDHKIAAAQGKIMICRECNGYGYYRAQVPADRMRGSRIAHRTCGPCGGTGKNQRSVREAEQEIRQLKAAAEGGKLDG